MWHRENIPSVFNKNNEKVNCNSLFRVWKKHFVRDSYAEKAPQAKFSFNCENKTKPEFQTFFFYLECGGKLAFFCDTSKGNKTEDLTRYSLFNQKTTKKLDSSFFYLEYKKEHSSKKDEKATTFLLCERLNRTSGKLWSSI